MSKNHWHDKKKKVSEERMFSKLRIIIINWIIDWELKKETVEGLARKIVDLLREFEIG